MTASCNRIQELILNRLSGMATPVEEREVAEHLAQCAGCRKFRDETAQDDEQLTAYADAVSRSAGDLPERVTAALEHCAIEIPRPIPLWRKILRSRIVRISTAAAFAAVAVLMVVFSSRQTAWAQIAEALQKVQRVHIVKITTGPDGKTEKCEWWFEKPSHLREDTDSKITVDDGVNRLVLDRAKKTAQLADSLLSWTPIEQNRMFKSTSMGIEEWIKEGGAEVSAKLTPLPDEEGGSVKVLAVEAVSRDKKRTVHGKLWMAADTKLPLRAEAEGQEETEKGVERGAERVTWNYEPMPPEVFSTAIPAGYAELPRQQHGVLKGRLLDEHDAPVADAVVYACVRSIWKNGASSPSSLEGKSDAQGSFEIKLPSNDIPFVFPVFVAAYRRGDPDHVAWTLITNPNDQSDKSGRTAMAPIPGDPGQCEVLTGDGEPRCGGASGIVLKMGPAWRLYGTVTGIGGRPICGAEIEFEPVGWWTWRMAVRPRGPGSTPMAQATTDAQGRYELTNVPRFGEGRYFPYLVSARAAGYPENHSNVESFAARGPLVSQEKNFVLFKGTITVTGQVVNDRGEPLAAGYEVVPVVEETEFWTCTQRTDAAGRFTLTGCPETPNLRVRIKGEYPPGSEVSKPTQDFYPETDAAIRYEAGKTKYEVKLVVIRPAITLRVVLKDSAGMPVPYFPVELYGRCLSELWMKSRLCKRADANGVCVLTGVPRAEGLQVLCGTDMPPEFVPALTPERQKVAAGNARFIFKAPAGKGNFMYVEPVNLAPDRNEQTVEITLLTLEEMKARKPSPK